uniref:EF-hand domain-containing protein n=1 Tax=Panagrolaimus sp. ES5 TaxID=591445 RepID=A0AC34GPC7_9BILA
MAKAVKKKSGKKRASGSEAAQFDQKTIQEFKEAFGIMDQNKDGIIDKSDLKDLYASMGQIASDAQMDAMLKEAPGPINFTVFLTLFGERLTGTDPEPTIVGAFQMFDKKDCGQLTEDELLKILKNKRGEPLDEEEIKAMYKGKPPIVDGYFCSSYYHWCPGGIIPSLNIYRQQGALSREATTILCDSFYFIHNDNIVFKLRSQCSQIRRFLLIIMALLLSDCSNLVHSFTITNLFSLFRLVCRKVCLSFKKIIKIQKTRRLNFKRINLYKMLKSFFLLPDSIIFNICS